MRRMPHPIGRAVRRAVRALSRRGGPLAACYIGITDQDGGDAQWCVRSAEEPFRRIWRDGPRRCRARWCVTDAGGNHEAFHRGGGAVERFWHSGPAGMACGAGHVRTPHARARHTRWSGGVLMGILSGDTEWTVTCDAPGCTAHYLETSSSSLLVMQHAVARGWMMTGGDGMICPTHSKEGRAHAQAGVR